MSKALALVARPNEVSEAKAKALDSKLRSEFIYLNIYNLGDYQLFLESKALALVNRPNEVSEAKAKALDSKLRSEFIYLNIYNLGDYQSMNRFEAVVIGSSAGGIRALSTVLSALPSEFPLPIIIVQHLHPDSGAYLARIFASKCSLKVKQADEKESLKKGVVYIAPPNYHLLIEDDRTLSLSIDAHVHYARPSVDVLFETAIYAYRDKLIGIILTGANDDGSEGVKKIKQMGGYVIVQDPATAEADVMPKAAIAATNVDKILPLKQIGPYLLQLVNRFCKNH